MKLIPPETCLFCGSELRGGGDTLAIYECGARLWIYYQPEPHDEWRMAGRQGDCKAVIEWRESPLVLFFSEISENKQDLVYFLNRHSFPYLY
jgi:hypothetical protein